MMELKKNERITSRDLDFAKWYTDIVTFAHLAAYSPVKGCMIIEPNGYAIWERIQSILDQKFKELGHENVAMPLFIPESLLNKEKEHVEGFSPEAAWVTIGGSKELEERLCIRPTSETLFCEYYSRTVQSYRDLPKLYNQWCSVVRWEKETRPFLRTREFLWQEGHTVHATALEAQKETDQMLEVYRDLFENYLAIPVVTGKKTEKEKFSGADYTLTIEALMYNGVSLQSATSHYFGQRFTIPFDVKFINQKNEIEYAYQTSWGTTTRMIGGLIMVHSDDNGLVLPPRIAPKQVVIVPIGKEAMVLEKAEELKAGMVKEGIRVFVDYSEKSPGFKFAEHEMNGIPLRLELGPRDLSQNQVVLTRRDTCEKETISLSETLPQQIKTTLETIQQAMFEKAQARNKEKTYVCHTYQEAKEIILTHPGFIKGMWCGDPVCEAKMKELNGLKSRCIPFEQEKVGEKCICCGKQADTLVIWGIQY